MVLHKYGQRLYNGLAATVTQHLRGVAQHIEQAHGAAFLPELRTRWQEHNKSMQMIRYAPAPCAPVATEGLGHNRTDPPAAGTPTPTVTS